MDLESHVLCVLSWANGNGRGNSSEREIMFCSYPSIESLLGSAALSWKCIQQSRMPHPSTTSSIPKPTEMSRGQIGHNTRSHARTICLPVFLIPLLRLCVCTIERRPRTAGVSWLVLTPAVNGDRTDEEAADAFVVICDETVALSCRLVAFGAFRLETS